MKLTLLLALYGTAAGYTATHESVIAAASSNGFDDPAVSAAVTFSTEYAWVGLCIDGTHNDHGCKCASEYSQITRQACEDHCKELAGCTGYAYHTPHPGAEIGNCKTYTEPLTKWTATTYQKFKCYKVKPEEEKAPPPSPPPPSSPPPSPPPPPPPPSSPPPSPPEHPPCVATCTAEPKDCAEALAMMAPGGCATTCDLATKNMYRAKFGCPEDKPEPPVNSLIGRDIAIYHSDHKKFIRMPNSDQGSLDKSDEVADGKLPVDWKWEKFKVVDAGAGEVAFYNAAWKRFIRMPGPSEPDSSNSLCMGRSIEKADGKLYPDWKWEKFKIVNAGAGEVAFYNAAWKRFMRMADSSVTCVDRSDERADGKLPSEWTWEKFKIVMVD